MKDLSRPARNLFELLIREVESGRFFAESPETFLGYGEVLEKLDLPQDAPAGVTSGERLQLNGLNELGPWIARHPENLPALTGLIVSKSANDFRGERRPQNVPGAGFFRLYGKKPDDWTWWMAEARKCLELDWNRYLEAADASPVIQAPIRSMNTPERSLITKAGYANGFENVRESAPERVVLFSARHRAEAAVVPADTETESWKVGFPQGPSVSELIRSFPETDLGNGTFQITGEAALGRLLRRAAALAMALPNSAAETYADEITKLDKDPPTPPSATETLALVKQRIGQDLFRKALMDYWGGACSVTGITIPELLRASHAKPWAECASDKERLNVFNGFLLCAHLDALFDRGLMTFDEYGAAVFSDTIDAGTRNLLNMTKPMKLRWLAPEHEVFLQWHREEVFAAI